MINKVITMNNHLKQSCSILLGVLFSTSIYAESAPYTAMRAKIQEGLRYGNYVNLSSSDPRDGFVGLIIISSAMLTLSQKCQIDIDSHNRYKASIAQLGQNPFISKAQSKQYQAYGTQEGIIAYNYLKSQGKSSQTCAKIKAS